MILVFWQLYLYIKFGKVVFIQGEFLVEIQLVFGLFCKVWWRIEMFRLFCCFESGKVLSVEFFIQANLV